MKKLISILLITSLSSSVFAQEAAFDDVKTLSAQEEAKAEEYIHQGLSEKEALKMCEEGNEKMKNLCDSKDAFGGGSLEAMMPAVTKAYTLIVQFGGGKLEKFKEANGNPVYKDTETGEVFKANKDGSYTDFDPEKPGETVEKDTEDETDYCAMVATAGEVVGTALTTLNNNKSYENYEKATPEAKQAASFRTLSKNHKDMKKTSQIQGGVWAGVSGCYASMMIWGNVKPSPMTIIKTAGAVLIGGFYLKKASAHGKRAKLLSAMADELPQAGDCNPYTDTTCFCNEDSSPRVDIANYNKFCIPSVFSNRNQNNDATICVDQAGKADAQCSCAQTNSCLDKNFKIGGMKFGLSPLQMQDPLAGISPLGKGFGAGDLNTANKNLNLAKKALANYKPDSLPNLSDSEKKLANTYSKLGIPKPAAALLAKKAAGINPSSSSLSALGGAMGSGISSNQGKNAIAGYSGPAKKTKSFSNGGNANGVKKSRTNKSYNPFGRRNKTTKTSGVHIEDFATKAQREAEIVPDKSRPIFDIISHRYKMSAWKEFQDTIKSETAK